MAINHGPCAMPTAHGPWPTTNSPWVMRMVESQTQNGLQASYRPENVFIWSETLQGNRFWRSNSSSSFKIRFGRTWWKVDFQNRTFSAIVVFGLEGSKVANLLKRPLLEFRADQSHMRGVNGRSKFVVANRPWRDSRSVSNCQHLKSATAKVLTIDSNYLYNLRAHCP